MFARWDGQCCYCDAPAAHLEHITPLSRGGRDVLTNVVPACADCNLDKGAQTLAEWAGNRLASTGAEVAATRGETP